MKKPILMAVIMSVASAASAAEGEQASATFTWSGTVPMTPTSNGFIIKDSVGNDIQRGSLVFAVDAAGKGVLTSASTLNFNVFDYTNDTVGDPVTYYSYQLTSVQATEGGLPQEQDAEGYYAIMADGAKIQVNDLPTTKATGGVTNLTVVPSDTPDPSNQPTAGEAVDVHARIVISDARYGSPR
ncbi:hypothetical protein JD524_16385 [Aeromonas caviae]|uniref:hypothetical protein n=1 Tax=Aeromonas caviae TaxID=648 RepID=UPI00191E384D|nr:hypothetical protein [Aeromonas caviae]MBL0656188.1 hypothetical protein [Aeromonas caviae]